MTEKRSFFGRLLNRSTPPAASATLPGDIFYDSTLGVVRYSDGNVVQVLEPIIEQATRVTIVGHSMQAEGGASKLDYGSSHKFSQFSPAQMDNLAFGAATVVSPGISPAPNLNVPSQQAGWEWLLYKCPNTERTPSFDSTGTILSGLNTTLTANTAANLAAGSSVAVPSSAGLANALAGQSAVSVPAFIGGANPELVYLSAAIDGTHVQNYRKFLLAHTSGDPIILCPDGADWATPRQLITWEYDWNDLAMMGVTTWQTAFPHAARASLAILREAARFGVDTVLHTDTTGTWAKAALSASGYRYKSTSSAGAVQTIKTPLLKAGMSVVLYFLTAANGDGASVNISVNGGANIAFDTRNINGFNNGSTRAATGQQMLSCKVLRAADGIVAGVNTITITCVTFQNTFYYAGFGVIPVSPIPVIVGYPFRLYDYSVAFGTTPYTPVDADQATMQTSIASLVAEWDSLVLPLTTMESVINKGVDFFTGDGVHLNDYGHGRRSVEFLKLMRSTYVPVANMMLPAPRPGRNWYPIFPTGSGGVSFATNWQNVGGTTLPAGYYKDVITGYVFIRGDIYCSSNTQGLNTTIFTLPPGHRPSYQIPVTFSGISGPLAGIINTDGTVQVAGVHGAGAVDGYVSLSSCAPWMAEL